jgi:cation:H+ antiporter
MLIELATLIIGFAALTWSADRFVAGAAATARLLGAPTLIIGITIVGFGTSAPEILISGVAAWQGQPGIAVGNALGSNIANIALILAATAIVYPLTLRSAVMTREMPLLGLVTLIALIVLLDRHLSRLEGIVLILGLVGVLAWLISQARRGDPVADALAAEVTEPATHDGSRWWPLAWLTIGLIVLLVSSRAIVWASVTIAQSLGISDFVIGLSIVALGTSLPELATCVTSVRKGESDIALGNIIGSNIFNLFAVLGVASTIAPLTAERSALMRDFPVMAGLTIVLFALGWRRRGPARISRLAGFLLLATYLGYQLTLGLSEINGLATTSELAP